MTLTWGLKCQTMFMHHPWSCVGHLFRIRPLIPLQLHICLCINIQMVTVLCETFLVNDFAGNGCLHSYIWHCGRAKWEADCVVDKVTILVLSR